MNPQDDSGKEVADALLVFGSDIVVFSVKHIASPIDCSRDIARERWTRRAIDKSIKQLCGACRSLSRIVEVQDPITKRRVCLPSPDEQRIHCICVALGGNEFGRALGRHAGCGYIHVLDDLAIIPIFLELSTVAEFVDYLVAREEFEPVKGDFDPSVGEEDLLAAYLIGERSFDSAAALPLAGLFERYISQPAYRETHQVEGIGYLWDDLILHLWSQLPRFVQYEAKIGAKKIPPPSERMMEKILRTMALHVRTERCALGHAALEIFSGRVPVSARVARVEKGLTYVFMCRAEMQEEHEAIGKELLGRCIYVQEILMPGYDVLGIASAPDLLRLSDDVIISLVFLEGSVGTKEMREEVESLALEVGWFQELSPKREGSHS